MQFGQYTVNVTDPETTMSHRKFEVHVMKLTICISCKSEVHHVVLQDLHFTIYILSKVHVFNFNFFCVCDRTCPNCIVWFWYVIDYLDKLFTFRIGRHKLYYRMGMSNRPSAQKEWHTCTCNSWLTEHIVFYPCKLFETLSHGTGRVLLLFFTGHGVFICTVRF